MNHRRDSKIGKILMYGASVAAISAATVSPAFAQADTASEMESVTVTGTLIRGINPVGTSIITVDAAAIKASGSLTTDQILTNIPQITSTFNQTNAVPAGAPSGGLKPSIRNVSSPGGGSVTLVLVDGHNLVGIGGLGTTPDPGVLPPGVLQRVEVVADGGASLYGANATTGIINFVTRSRFEGLQADVSVGSADGYTAGSVSLMGGKDWGSGSAYVATELKSNTYLMNRDRSYLRQDLTNIGGRDTRATACALPNITVTGAAPNQYAQTSLASNTPGSLRSNVSGPYGALNSTTNAGFINRCDTAANASYLPSEQSQSMFGSFEQHIADGIDFSTKLLWTNRLNTNLGSVSSSTGTIDTTNPYFQSINGETQQTVQFDWSPYYGSKSLASTSRTQLFQVTPEVVVALPGDWEAKLQTNYGRSLTDYRGRSVNSNVLGQALRTTTVNGTRTPTLVADPVVGNAIDPYNVALSNPTLINEIVDYGTLQKIVQHQEQAQLNLDGTLFTLPGGAVKAVIGGKYSWEDFNAVDANAPIGQIAGTGVPGSQFTVEGIDRNVESAFSEIVLPVVGPDNAMPFVHSLTFDVSARYDSFSDFGDTKNFKLGMNYEPFEELTIRANLGTSFDAPSLADTLAPDGRLQYTAQRTSPNLIVPPGTSAADALRPSVLVPGGNPNLKPEDAHTSSIGADFHPGEYFGVDFTGLDLSITGWHVGIAHQIALAPYNQVTLFQIPAFAQYYILNPTAAQLASYGYNVIQSFPGPDINSAYTNGVNPPYIAYDARRNNIGNAYVDGLDFAVNYRSDFDFGTVSGGISGTTTLSNRTGFPGATFSSIQATGVPLYSLSGNIGVTTGPWSARASINYSPSYLQNPAAQAATLYHQTRVGSFEPVNLFVSYDLEGVTSWTSGASISAALNNVMDDHPTIILSGGTANGSTIGRYFVLGLHKQF